MIEETGCAEEFTFVRDHLWLTLNSDHTIATLHFCMHNTRNAISFQIAEELCNLSRIFIGEDSLHPLAKHIRPSRPLLLVLRSHCKDVFLSGGDLKELAGMSSADGSVFIENMRHFTRMLRTSPFVSIAVLNGLAAGGGAEIAMAADLRVAVSSEAQLHFAQTAWGVPAGWGMMTDLREKNVFSSERRRGIALAAQERMTLQTLALQGILDASFAASTHPMEDCNAWLSELAHRLSVCPESLRSQLIVQRSSQPADNLETFDKTLFAQYWLGNEHQRRLQSYLDSRSKKTKVYESRNNT